MSGHARTRATCIGLMVLAVSGGSSFAQRKSCEDLKTEIAAKLDLKGVKNYMLTIVPAGNVRDSDKVVGSCDGGTKRIVYTRE
jgi:hypothetical protein